MSLIKCVNCGQEYTSKIDRCPHCNFRPILFKCTECGNLINRDDKTCNKCGNPIVSEDIKPATKDEIGKFYLKCVNQLSKAQSSKDFENLFKSFNTLGEYEDAAVLKVKCEEKIKEIKEAEENETNYRNEVAKLDSCDNQKMLLELLDGLKKYEGSFDANKQIKRGYKLWQEMAYKEACESKNAIFSKELFMKLGEYKDSPIRLNDSIKKEKEHKDKQKKIGLIIIGTVVGCLIILFVITGYIIPKKNYKKGMEAYYSKDYHKAIEFLEKSGDQGKSEKLLKDCYYICGIEALEKEQYSKAESYLESAEAYKDKSLFYARGHVQLEYGEYEEAAKQFNKCGNYKDAVHMKNVAKLLTAKSLFDNEEYKKAKDKLENIPPGLTYEKTNRDKLLNIINNNWGMLNLAGTYKVDSSYMEVKSTSKSTGIWNNWYWDDNSGELELCVKLLDSGKIKLTGTVSFWIVYDYSTLGDVVDDYTEYKTFDINKKISSTPHGLKIAPNTKLTVSGNKINVNYYKTETNKDAFFNYMYRTDMVYKK